MVYAVLLFVAPSQALLVPIFVAKVLRDGPAQLGLLFGASGIGTVVGSLFVASFGDRQNKGRLLVSANVAWVLALGLFALSRSFAVSFGLLAFMAAAQSVFSTLVITLMQGAVEAKMRGRIMSLNTLLNMGVRPLGDFPVSVATSFFGIANAALLSAVVVAVAGALVFSSRRAIWKG
jgi:predicted MFS family arabinose efflux permease